MTDIRARAARPSVPALARKAIRYELSMWLSLYRWILRRPTGPGQSFGYAGILTPVFLAFIGVSAIELPIVHLLLPWETARLVADALGLYGLFWMLGLLASMRVNRHVVGEAGIRVRYGPSADLTVPWPAIAAVHSRHRSQPNRKTFQYAHSDGGRIGSVAILSQTTVDVRLRHPVTVGLPGDGGEPITKLRLYADDPAAFVASARRQLAAQSSRA